jgi:hypothetical protein
VGLVDVRQGRQIDATEAASPRSDFTLDRNACPEPYTPSCGRGSGGRVVMHRTANPRMPVRFRPGPPISVPIGREGGGKYCDFLRFEITTFGLGSDRRGGTVRLTLLAGFASGRRSRELDLIRPFDTPIFT